MADVELLPLPKGNHAGDMSWDAQVYGRYETRSYARACVEANLAPLQAENARLRAEVERLHKPVILSDWQKLEARADRLAEALRWAERHCPCGARPESPDTHPHLPGCLVGAALAQESNDA